MLIWFTYCSSTGITTWFISYLMSLLCFLLTFLIIFAIFIAFIRDMSRIINLSSLSGPNNPWNVLLCRCFRFFFLVGDNVLFFFKVMLFLTLVYLSDLKDNSLKKWEESSKFYVFLLICSCNFICKSFFIWFSILYLFIFNLLIYYLCFLSFSSNF